MQYEEKSRNTLDRTVSNVCSEIDDLKEEVKFWREKYETELKDNIKNLNQNLEWSKRDLANAIMFSLSVKDDKDGNMAISKEDRLRLRDNYLEKKYDDTV